MVERGIIQRAFFISIVAHLFWLTAVVIVVPPVENMNMENSKVSFIGPILNKTVFELMLTDTGGQYTGFEKSFEKAEYFEEEPVRIRRPKRHMAHEIFSFKVNKKVQRSIRDLIMSNKAKPLFDFHIPEPITNSVDKSIEVRGEAYGRKVLHIPEAPMVDGQTLDQSAAEFLIDISFIISPQGKVISAEPKISSGDPNIDILAVRYVKEWIFNDIELSGGNNQQGVVRVALKSNGQVSYD